MYTDDSFNTLTMIQQTGLTAISLLLGLFCIFICFRLFRNRSRLSRLLISLGVLFLLVWLSPQIYYSYYLIIFDGLPFQAVIKKPPSPWALTQLLSFQSNASLSDHTKAILGWVLIAMALLKRKI